MSPGTDTLAPLLKKLGTLRCVNIRSSPSVSTPGSNIKIYLDWEGSPAEELAFSIGLYPVKPSSAPIAFSSIKTTDANLATLFVPREAITGEYELRIKLAHLLLAKVSHEVTNELASKEAATLERAQTLVLKSMDAVTERDYNGAHEYATQAVMQYCKASHDELAYLVWHDLGAALLGHKQDDLAMDALRKAAIGFQSLGDVKREASTLFLIGQGLAVREKSDAARFYLDQASLMGDKIGFDVLVLRSSELLARHVDPEKYFPQFLHAVLRAESEPVRSEAILLCRNLFVDRQDTSFRHRLLARPFTGKGKFRISAGALSTGRRYRKLLLDPGISHNEPWLNILTLPNAALLTTMVSSLCAALTERFNPNQQVVISTSRSGFKEMFTISLDNPTPLAKTTKFVQAWIAEGEDFQFYCNIADVFGVSLTKLSSKSPAKSIHFIKGESTPNK